MYCVIWFVNSLFSKFFGNSIAKNYNKNIFFISLCKLNFLIDLAYKIYRYEWIGTAAFCSQFLGDISELEFDVEIDTVDTESIQDIVNDPSFDVDLANSLASSDNPTLSSTDSAGTEYLGTDCGVNEYVILFC